MKEGVGRVKGVNRKLMSPSLLFFTIIVSGADILTMLITSVKSTIITSLAGSLPYSAVLGLVAVASDFLFNTSIINTFLSVVAGFLIYPFIISTIVLCTFFAVAAVSKKGEYSTTDFIIASMVFFLECIPVISAAPGWIFFTRYLYQKQRLSRLIK